MTLYSFTMVIIYFNMFKAPFSHIYMYVHMHIVHIYVYVYTHLYIHKYMQAHADQKNYTKDLTNIVSG